MEKCLQNCFDTIMFKKMLDVVEYYEYYRIIMNQTGLN